MKKKRISYVFAVIASAVMMLAASCSNLIDATVSDGSTASGATVATATINGIDATTLVTQLAASRTVLPAPYDLDNGGLIYVLSGKSYNGSLIEAHKVEPTSTDSTTGTITISFPDTSTWELTLTAYKTADDTGVEAINYKDGTTDAKASDPVLTATTEVGFGNGTPSIVFNMNVTDLTTPGKIEVAATAGFTYTTDSVDISKFEIAVYDIINGTYIKNADGTADITTGKVAIGATPALSTAETNLFTSWADAAALANLDNITPGEYLLGITFYSTYNSTDRKVGFWSDYIVIAPGQTTEFDKVISGINEKPDDPENFMAQLVKDSETLDTYKVKLTWDDISTNETNFEVDLYEVLDAAKATELTTTTIKTATNATKLATLGFTSLYSAADVEDNLIVDFKDGSKYYGGGSLFSSSTSATLKLETGKLYEVVLRAVNNEGQSADVARIACTAAAIAAGSDNTGYDAEEKHINRVRLSYITDPYTLLIGGTDGGTFAGEYVTYAIYEGTALPLIAAADFEDLADADATPADGKYALKYGTGPVKAECFKGWLDAATETASTADDYITVDANGHILTTTYKNVTVLADVSYDIDATVHTYTYDTSALDSTFVTVTAYTAADTAGTALTAASDVFSTQYTYDSQTVAATKLTIAVASTVTAGDTYTDYRISVDGVAHAGSSYTINRLSQYASGNHSVVIAGKKASDGVWYSYTFMLNVQR